MNVADVGNDRVDRQSARNQLEPVSKRCAAHRAAVNHLPAAQRDMSAGGYATAVNKLLAARDLSAGRYAAGEYHLQPRIDRPGRRTTGGDIQFTGNLRASEAAGCVIKADCGAGGRSAGLDDHLATAADRVENSRLTASNGYALTARN